MTEAGVAKPFWRSRTFWVNVLAAVVAVVQSSTDWWCDPAVQATVLAVINLVLRALTSRPVSLHGTTAAALMLLATGGLTGCGGVQVCREAGILLRDAGRPRAARVVVTCDGVPLVEIEADRWSRDDDEECR